MALFYDLPVYRDTYKLILLLFDITQNFPREYKYTLGQDIKRDGINLVRSIYRANRAESKKVHLEEFLDNFEILKLEIRLCVDMKILSLKTQAALSEYFESIGRQITGWKNANP